MTTPYESGEALEIDEQALDRVWEAVRCELLGYKANTRAVGGPDWYRGAPQGNLR